jgi:hypothetical protein
MLGEPGHGRQRLAASPLPGLDTAPQISLYPLGGALLCTWHTIMIPTVTDVRILDTLTELNNVSNVASACA